MAQLEQPARLAPVRGALGDIYKCIHRLPLAAVDDRLGDGAHRRHAVGRSLGVAHPCDESLGQVAVAQSQDDIARLVHRVALLGDLVGPQHEPADHLAVAPTRVGALERILPVARLLRHRLPRGHALHLGGRGEVLDRALHELPLLVPIEPRAVPRVEVCRGQLGSARLRRDLVRLAPLQTLPPVAVPRDEDLELQLAHPQPEGSHAVLAHLLDALEVLEPAVVRHCDQPVQDAVGDRPQPLATRDVLVNPVAPRAVGHPLHSVA